MAVSQDQFDADLNELIAAVQALIANPKVANLANEDAEVKALLANVQTASGTTPTP